MLVALRNLLNQALGKEEGGVGGCDGGGGSRSMETKKGKKDEGEAILGAEEKTRMQNLGPFSPVTPADAVLSNPHVFPFIFELHRHLLHFAP